MLVGGWWGICYGCDYLDIVIKCSLLIFYFLVLVGAFSDFGRADTGNPVQIFPDFVKSEARLGN